MKSKCCNAKVEETGGGYVEKNIAPIIYFCSSCGEEVSFSEIIWSEKEKEERIDAEDLQF